MNGIKSNGQHKASYPERKPGWLMLTRIARRQLLSRSARVLGGLAGWRAAGVALGGGLALGDQTVSDAAPDVVVPAYVSPGYRLVAQYTDRPDGFGGPSEVALWYRNPSNTLAFARPLSIFQAPIPVRSVLPTTEHHQPAYITLVGRFSQTVTAEYHDGWWTVPSGQRGPFIWDNSDVHSVKFTYSGLTFGIRGCRMAGIDFGELVKIASSLL